MKVDNGNPGPIRSERPRDARATPAAGNTAAQKPTPLRNEPVDRVEISAAGRARAARLAPVDPGSATRLAEIRQRVLEGAYDTDAVVADVAQRILERGDA